MSRRRTTRVVQATLPDELARHQAAMLAIGPKITATGGLRPYDPARACNTCTHYGWQTASAAVWCVADPQPRQMLTPAWGCERWMREAGADCPAEVA